MVSVVGVPPTLVASMYGMNFKEMPELNWHYGYPYALALIVLTAVVPLIVFKLRAGSSETLKTTSVEVGLPREGRRRRRAAGRPPGIPRRPGPSPNGRGRRGAPSPSQQHGKRGARVRRRPGQGAALGRAAGGRRGRPGAPPSSRARPGRWRSGRPTRRPRGCDRPAPRRGAARVSTTASPCAARRAPARVQAAAASPRRAAAAVKAELERGTASPPPTHTQASPRACATSDGAAADSAARGQATRPPAVRPRRPRQREHPPPSRPLPRGWTRALRRPGARCGRGRGRSAGRRWPGPRSTPPRHARAARRAAAPA